MSSFTVQELSAEQLIYAYDKAESEQLAGYEEWLILFRDEATRRGIDLDDLPLKKQER